MTQKITPEDRLVELGIQLPPAPKAIASYVPWRLHGDLLFVSGQLPLVDGRPSVLGIVGRDIQTEAAHDAARTCAVNLISQVRVACDGDLSRVRAVVRLGAFVAADPAFTDHPKIVNGASDLMVDVFGPDVGQHARTAVGVASLPMGVPIEIEAQFTIAPRS